MEEEIGVQCVESVSLLVISMTFCPVGAFAVEAESTHADDRNERSENFTAPSLPRLLQ